MADESVPGFPEPQDSWPQAAYSGQPSTGGRQDAGWIASRRSNFIELILQQVVLAITNVLMPGPAFAQLKAWADGIGDAVANIPVLGPFLEWLASLFGIDIGEVGDPDFDPGDIWANVVNAFINPLGFFANLVGGFIPNFQIPGFDASKIVSGFFSNGLIPGLTNLIDDIFAGFTGLGGGGWSNGDAADAVKSQAAIAAANAAAVAFLLAKVNAQASDSAVDATDDFERIAADMGVGWAARYIGPGGTWGTPDGHNASYTDSGSGVRRAILQRRKSGETDSATDYQIAGVVLETSPEGTDFFFSEAHNNIYLRMNEDMTTYVDVDWTATVVQIWAVVNDVYTLLTDTVDGGPATRAIGRPSAGSSLVGAAGTVDGIRYYQAIYNGSPVLTVRDPSNITKVGLGYRRWGFGGVATSRGFGQSSPGAVRAFAASDSDAGAASGGSGGDETTGLYLTQDVSRPNVYTTTGGGGLRLAPKAGTNRWETVSSGGSLLEVNPSRPNVYRTM